MKYFKGVLVAAVIAATAACGSEPAGVSPANEAGESSPGRVHVDYAVTGLYLMDWARYGDVFATFTVTGAEALPITEEERGLDEGILIGRQITATIDDVHWRRHGAADPPAQISYPTLGWIMSNGERRRVLANNSPDLIIGQRYVAVLARYDEGWAPLGSDSVALLAPDGHIDVPDENPSAGYHPVGGLRFIDGRTPSEVGPELDKVPVNPAFAADPTLDPQERYELENPPRM